MNSNSIQRSLCRRQFLQGSLSGIGMAAVATLLNREGAAEALPTHQLHHAPRAKRIVFLCQSGAPSQIDLFDEKPELRRRHGEHLPESFFSGQRLTTMTAGQNQKLITASKYRFKRYGKSGQLLSELLPWQSKIVDEWCLIHSMHTEAINHDPAMTFLSTGSEQSGRPSMGAWLSYGLGSVHDNLPTFVVGISGGSPGDQPLMGRLWGSGFLPSQHQGMRLRSEGEPVLFLKDPPGLSRRGRGRMINALGQLNQGTYDRYRDPETQARIQQFETAFGMQAELPVVADFSNEPTSTFELYGEEAKQPGSYAANCLLARRLLEKGVRFVQLYHRGWDHHKKLPERLELKCKETDQASAALVLDLKQRGLLDDTLVIWGGEFGRTLYCQGELTKNDYGRDHHPRCFSIWMAGGGIKRGVAVGKTDELSYNVVEDPIHIHDLQATILHMLGFDHERLTYRHQGRDFRLTDVAGEVKHQLIR